MREFLGGTGGEIVDLIVGDLGQANEVAQRCSSTRVQVQNN